MTDRSKDDPCGQNNARRELVRVERFSNTAIKAINDDVDLGMIQYKTKIYIYKHKQMVIDKLYGRRSASRIAASVKWRSRPSASSNACCCRIMLCSGSVRMR